MKPVTILAIILGILIALAGVVSIVTLSIGNAVVLFGIGAICALTGCCLWSLDRLHTKMDSFNSSIKKLSKDSSAEQIVDQLRAEGLLNPGKSLTDSEMEELI